MDPTQGVTIVLCQLIARYGVHTPIRVCVEHFFSCPEADHITMGGTIPKDISRVSGLRSERDSVGVCDFDESKGRISVP